MVGVPQRIQAVEYAVSRGLGQRRACALMCIARSMLTYEHRQPVKDAAARAAIDSVVSAHPAWGRRLVYGWLREQGHQFSICSVYRIYRSAGCAAHWRKRTRKIKRNNRINPIAEQAHDVWCMDFAEDRLMSGRKLTALLVKDEATSFGLNLTIQRSFKAIDVERILDQLVAQHGAPRFIRSDNGGQFIAYAVQRWALRRNITLAYIQPGKPWQNGFAESFVGTFRREVLNAEVFFSLEEAHIFSNQWLTMYNTERPHSRHNYRPPSTAFNNKAA